ncbi:MAG: hypothetical protein WBV23_11820 [Desulfobaccales bacterium]
MITPDQALSSIPPALREPLIEEYNNIVQNYMERRWSPSELSGGKFCEIVYTILEGFLSGSFASSPSKPRDFVSACRSLETKASSVRSFQILIPRMLPPLYEIRNNRGVGHVGGDVDPNHMDAMSVLSMTSWIMGELVRASHSVGTEEAQRVVDSLTERRIPLVWQVAGLKRVLNPKLSLKDQILLLLSSVPSEVDFEELFKWTDYKNKSYFKKTLIQLHKLRFLEFNERENKIQILPPGSDYILKFVM